MRVRRDSEDNKEEKTRVTNTDTIGELYKAAIVTQSCSVSSRLRWLYRQQSTVAHS